MTNVSLAIVTGRLAPVLVVGAVLAAGSLAACSSNESAATVPPEVVAPEDAGPPLENADVSTPPDAGGGKIAWSACKGKPSVECATVSVPLDYEDASLGKVDLALARRRARTADRLGVLFVNPGGPGAPVVASLLQGFPAIAANQSVLLDDFDVIAMDPRGVGQSMPANCFTSEIEQSLLALPALPKNDAEWTARFTAMSQVGPSCKAKADEKLLARMDSATVARDMDAVRDLLGEEKINYLGFSYGTHIGAMYATLFPSRVRSFVLDSPVYVTRDRRERSRDVAAAEEDSLGQFFAWCATSPRCTFGPTTGRAPEAIGAAYDALTASLDATPLTTSTRSVDGAAVRFATIFLLYMPPTQWPQLGKALAAAAGGDGAALQELVDGNIAPSNPAAENYFSAFLSIASADGPLPADLTQDQLRAYIEGELPVLAPRLGAVGPANELPFLLGWPIAVAHVPPAISATSAPPLLLTATRHDPASPYSDAAKVQAALGNGSYLVTYEGSGHGAVGTNPCLAVAATVFLLDPSKAPSTTSCAGIDP